MMTRRMIGKDGDNSDEEEGEEDHVDDQESIQGELLRAIRHEAAL